MIKHIVMFQFGMPGTELSNEMKSTIEEIKKALEDLMGVVPSLQSMNVGVNNNPNEKFHLVLTSTFENYPALEEYVVHPAHQAVSQKIRSIMTARACVDYEE